MQNTLKRIEVNICYEVGITQFARIWRFLLVLNAFLLLRLIRATLLSLLLCVVRPGGLGWSEVGLLVRHARPTQHLSLHRCWLNLNTPLDAASSESDFKIGLPRLMCQPP